MRGKGKIEGGEWQCFRHPCASGRSPDSSPAIVPGAGYSVAKQATASFHDQRRHHQHEDFKVSGKLFGMIGHGDLHFLDNKLDFDIRIDAKGAGRVLTPVYELFEYKGEGTSRSRLAPEAILVKAPLVMASTFCHVDRSGDFSNSHPFIMSSEVETSHSLCEMATSALRPVEMKTNGKILLGAHMSIGGGVHRAIERSCSIDCTAMQIFVKNNMQWFARPLDRAEINAFVRHAQRCQLERGFRARELPDQSRGNEPTISHSTRCAR